MTVPLAARSVIAIFGALLVLTTWGSVIGTLIVPRPAGGWLTRWVDRIINSAFRVVTRGIADHKQRDRVLAAQAAAILLAQLVAWLGIFYVGYSLLLWPFISTGLGSAFDAASPDVFGPNAAVGNAEKVVADLAAFTGLAAVTLQIAYLPTLYSEFNRREKEVALLNPLPDLYGQGERWAAEVAESHTTYLPLVRFRSPRPLSSWVTALLAVLDSAALYLALCPQAAPVVPARLCLRGGFECLTRVARAMGLDVPEEVDPAVGITLSYDEFLDAVAHMREVDFPIERDPADAWPDFVGWRVNYEQAAYAVAAAVDAAPAMWSGPRRRRVAAVAPIRPPLGR